MANDNSIPEKNNTEREQVLLNITVAKLKGRDNSITI
jgi:hypothetical protein